MIQAMTLETLPNKQKRVLFVVSAADHWTLKDGSQHPTGYWGEELAVPHRIFSEAGWDVDLATPGGVAPTIDRLSMSLMGGTAAKRLELLDYLLSIKTQLHSPKVLSEVNPDDYDLVFYPGGHGPMEDLVNDADSGALLAHRLQSGQPLALLCHAPAALLAAKNSDGSWAARGYRMTGFSNLEEWFNPFSWKAKWFLEDRLREEGGLYSKAALPMMPCTVVDRQLYTGQNPASSEELAKRLVSDLSSELPIQSLGQKTTR